MRNSDLLSDCLVDSDADATRRATQRRRKALTISLAVESVLLAALLVWPLLNPGTMSARYVVVPVPPYAGGGHHTQHSANSSQTPHRNIDVFTPIYPVFGLHPRPSPISGSGDDAPSIGDGSYGEGNGPGTGPGIFGSPGSGPVPPRPPEPKAPAPTKPIFVSQGAQEAMLIRRVEPVYPAIARQIHLSGTVELRAIIAKNGEVINLEVVSGNLILAQAAAEAVRQWRYRPTLLNNQPIEVQTFVTVKFVFDR